MRASCFCVRQLGSRKPAITKLNRNILDNYFNTRMKALTDLLPGLEFPWFSEVEQQESKP